MVAVPGGVDCGLDRILLWSGLSIEHCFACIAGGEYTDQESAALYGVHWRVPMLAEVDAFVNSLEEVVTYLEKEFPITGKLHFEPIVELRFFNGFRNLEIELETKLIYQLNSRTKVGFFYRYDPDSHVTTIHEAHSAGVGFNLAF